jgi:hypothetical protein
MEKAAPRIFDLVEHPMFDWGPPSPLLSSLMIRPGRQLLNDWCLQARKTYLNENDQEPMIFWMPSPLRKENKISQDC